MQVAAQAHEVFITQANWWDLPHTWQVTGSSQYLLLHCKKKQTICIYLQVDYTCWNYNTVIKHYRVHVVLRVMCIYFQIGKKKTSFCLRVVAQCIVHWTFGIRDYTLCLISTSALYFMGKKKERQSKQRLGYACTYLYTPPYTLLPSQSLPRFYWICHCLRAYMYSACVVK